MEKEGIGQVGEASLMKKKIIIKKDTLTKYHKKK